MCFGALVEFLGNQRNASKQTHRVEGFSIDFSIPANKSFSFEK